MQPALRPMNLGEILDGTFEIYRRRFFLFVGIGALPGMAILALHCADIAWLHSEQWLGQLDRNGMIGWNAVIAFGYSHVSEFLATLIMPAFVTAVSATLFGELSSIRNSFVFVGARWRTYLWIAVLKTALKLFCPELLAIGIMLGTSFVLDKLKMMENSAMVGGMVLITLAGMFCLVYWVGTWISMAIPASAIEGMSGFKAIRRSWVLTKDSRWRIFICWFGITICSIAIQAGVQYTIRWIAILVYRSVHHTGFNRSFYAGSIYFAYAVIHTVIGPLFPIAVTLFYYDQRVRKEGYDLERMMVAAGLERAVDGPPAALAENSGEDAFAAGKVTDFIRNFRGFR